MQQCSTKVVLPFGREHYLRREWSEGALPSARMVGGSTTFVESLALSEAKCGNARRCQCSLDRRHHGNGDDQQENLPRHVETMVGCHSLRISILGDMTLRRCPLSYFCSRDTPLLSQPNLSLSPKHEQRRGESDRPDYPLESLLWKWEGVSQAVLGVHRVVRRRGVGHRHPAAGASRHITRSLIRAPSL